MRKREQQQLPVAGTQMSCRNYIFYKIIMRTFYTHMADYYFLKV